MEQDLIRERYDLSMARIQEILTEETVPENYRDYFRKVTEFIIQCGEVLKAKEDGSLEQMTLEEGRTLNHRLYADVLPENYETSYTNPAYAVKTLGEEYGKLLSYLYAEIRGDIIYAFEGRVLDLVIGNEALIEIYNLFEGETLPAAKEIKDVLYWSRKAWIQSLTSRKRSSWRVTFPISRISTGSVRIFPRKRRRQRRS